MGRKPFTLPPSPVPYDVIDRVYQILVESAGLTTGALAEESGVFGSTLATVLEDLKQSGAAYMRPVSKKNATAFYPDKFYWVATEVGKT